jgi:oligopeptide transport system substrate-binding protein
MTRLARKAMLILLGLLVLAFGAVLVACEEEEEEGTPTASPEVTASPTPTGAALAENQELRIHMSGEPTSLDPQIAAFANDIGVIKQLFRGLLYYDEDLGPVPAAAVEVPSTENGGISEDGLTYTFTLRDDLVWSDGEPLTAADFEYTLKRLFDPEVGGQGYYYSFYTNIIGAEDYVSGEGSADDVAVTAIDDTTLELQLSSVQPTLLQLMAMWPAMPVRQDVVEEHGDAWTEAGNLIGNGPFILTDWEHETQITLEANPNYWGDDQPTLDTLVFQIIPDDSVALIAYQNDELDLTRIPLPDIGRFEEDPELLKYAELVTFAQEFNNTEEPFTDPIVRKAFKMAVDSDAYVDQVRQGSGLPANSWIPPGMPGHNPDIGADYAFDPEGAKDLLAQSTYGGPEDLPGITVTIADTSAGRLTAEFLQEQLRTNLDVSIEIEILESSTYEDRYLASEFQFVLGGWGADYADPENWLPELFGTDAGLNQYKYSNPEVDDLLAQAAVELDNDTRLDLYDQAQRIIIDEDMGIAPLYVRIRSWLVKPWVDGITTTGTDSNPGDWFYTDVRILEQ